MLPVAIVASPIIHIVAILERLTSTGKPLINYVQHGGAMALHKGIAGYLRGCGVNVSISDELLGNKTLDTLLRLGRKFGLTLPPNIQADLVGIRNRVAHSGYAAISDEADKAIEIARTVTGELDPLPSHCDELRQWDLKAQDGA